VIATAAPRPPGPRGLPFVGSLLAFRRDPLAFVIGIRDRFGDVAAIDVAGLPFIQLSAPAHVDIVLRERSRDFVKGALGAEKRRLFGQGLATSDGELWRRQRQLAQPAFHHARIAAHAEVVARFAAEHVDALVRARGKVIDLHAEMMRLTLRVVGKVLFGADVERDAPAVGAALEEVMPFFTRQDSMFLRLVPRRLRRYATRGFHAAVDRLDTVIATIIEERRRAGDGGPRDLLGAWMTARDERGEAMSDRQLRDEVMTAFLAGHETTALALSWTFAQLAFRPGLVEALQLELAEVVGARAPGYGDLAALRLLGATLAEAMRLHPPAWILVREAVRPVEIGGYTIPPRAFVVMSPWVVHRDPRWFALPHRFIPERWLDDLEARLPRFAYFPFGGGPRGCIGSGLARMEALMVLAVFLQRARFVADPLRPVVPEPSISLRPRGGVWGRVVERSAS
jgi:cytochrome P450